jgi:hypothetical protein
MSITLTSPPPLIAFSGDRIAVEFTCTDIFSQVGNKAINKIVLPDPVNVNYGIVLKWGGKSVTMTAAAIPDNSGTQFYATAGLPVLPESQRQCFAANYLLSQDFLISVSGNEITLTARQNGTLYNITGFLFSSGTVETLRPNYGVQLRLYLENIENNGYNLVGEYSLNVQVGPPHIASTLIGDKLHTIITEDIRRLLPEIPFFGTMSCNVSCRKYFFEYAETYNDQVRKVFTSDIRTVIHGGFSTLGQATKNISSELYLTNGIACFLKQGARKISTRADQPQFLYFYNTRPTFDSSMQLKLYFTDGTVATKTLYSLNIQSSRKYGFNLQFDKVFIPGDYPTKEVDQYEVWLQNSAGIKISESRFYVLDTAYKPYYKYFLNWSSWGTMDSRMFYGKGSHELNLVQSKAEKSFFNPLEISKGSSLIYNSRATTTFTATTGFLKDKSELLFNRDFFLSVLKYKVYGENILPIEILSKTIPEITDGQNLYAQKFEYSYLYDDDAYTEGDIAPVVAPAPVIVGLIYFGPAVTAPLNEAAIFALGNSLPAETYSFPMATGLNRIFCIALPPGKAIASVIDQTTQENLKDLFLITHFNVSGLNYNICTMQNLLPFTVSHNLLISIINA